MLALLAVAPLEHPLPWSSMTSSPRMRWSAPRVILLLGVSQHMPTKLDWDARKMCCSRVMSSVSILGIGKLDNIR